MLNLFNISISEMVKYIAVQDSSEVSLLFVWILIIVLVAVIGALMQRPPERSDQSIHENNSKVQYITIGGGSQTKSSING